MLKRKTILLMVSAIALLGLVVLIEGNRNVVNNQQGDPAASADPALGESEPLFSFEEEEIDALEIQREEDTLSFTKQEDDTWQMTAPEAAAAEAGAIAFLLSQITTPSAHTFSTSTSDLRDFGLQNPEATVVLSAGDTPYTLTVGDDDFTGDQLYVRADPPASALENSEQIKIHVVSGGMRNAVNRPTQDWLITEENDTEEATDPEDTAPEEATDSEEAF